MFGFGRTKTPAETAQEAVVERAKDAIRKLVHSLDNATPADAERIGKMVKDRCAMEKAVPVDFKQKALARARDLECNVYMRTCDTLLHEAAQLGAAEKLADRNTRVGKAREYHGKACALGAEPEWRKAFQRSVEVVMLTGGVHKDGPSRAKPADPFRTAAGANVKGLKIH